MSEKVEDAPYRYVYEDVTVKGKKVRVYELGKERKELVEKIPTLATDTRVTYILQRLMDVESFIESEMLPFRMSNLLDFIKENTGINTLTLNKHLFDKNGLRQRINFAALDALKKQGLIESVKVGRGKPRKWMIKKKGEGK